ncbi:MAG: hypothetical protein HPY65_10485 [Syntrophaceae bacterium]|nr:hypothetical protein [Syntrophaceae bacterium]
MNRSNLILCQSLAVFLILLVSFPAFALSCADSDQICLRRAVEGHAVRRIAFWKPFMKGTSKDRIRRAPADLIDYLVLDNRLNGFAETPVPVDLSPGFAADLEAALEALPPVVHTLMEPKLAGIFIVRNLGGTGYMEAVLDERETPAAGFIVLDEAVLGKTANAWFTWREGTPFRSDQQFRLEGVIENPADDNRKNAIQFILLHEIGHLLSVGEWFHPFWFEGPAAAGNEGDYPFLDLSWTVSPDGKTFLSRYEHIFPCRKDIVFYGRPKLDGAALPDVYGKLAATNFVTLYGATNPYDDFAEAFATYVHTVMMKKPYEIRVLKGREVQSVFRSCWGEERCEAKQRILAGWLRRN